MYSKVTFSKSHNNSGVLKKAKKAWKPMEAMHYKGPMSMASSGSM